MIEQIGKDIERANADIKNLQYELKKVPKQKEIELLGMITNSIHFNSR